MSCDGRTSTATAPGYTSSCADSLARYVTYTFWGMEPFDQKEALRRVGIRWPKAEPEHMWEDGSKRWQPFGEYEKLVLDSHQQGGFGGGVAALSRTRREKPRR